MCTGKILSFISFLTFYLKLGGQIQWQTSGKTPVVSSVIGPKVMYKAEEDASWENFGQVNTIGPENIENLIILVAGEGFLDY